MERELNRFPRGRDSLFCLARCPRCECAGLWSGDLARRQWLVGAAVAGFDSYRKSAIPVWSGISSRWRRFVDGLLRCGEAKKCAITGAGFGLGRAALYGSTRHRAVAHASTSRGGCGLLAVDGCQFDVGCDANREGNRFGVGQCYLWRQVTWVRRGDPSSSRACASKNGDYLLPAIR